MSSYPALPQTARAFIVAGGNLGPWIVQAIHPHDYLIGADRGALFLIQSGFTPQLSIGDFDSVTEEEWQRITQGSEQVQRVDAFDKDSSDTELAMRTIIARGYRHIVIAGAIGSRFDHSLANVQLLKQANEQNVFMTLLDEHNEIALCANKLAIKRDERFPYISLLPLTEQVEGVSLDGFRYPLQNATLIMGVPLAISNELIEDVGHIRIHTGLLLVIRSRD